MSDFVPFDDVRAVFEKTGAAVYFSHLDLIRTVSRALRRCGLDIWMTEGFTPRPHLVFTPPLSLGYQSLCEIMDFRLNKGASLDKDAFFSAFPAALKIRDLYIPQRKLKEIAFAGYDISFACSASGNDISSLFSKPVNVIKKTKRSQQLTDITKFIKHLDLSEFDGIINMSVILSCSAVESLSPSYLLSAMTQNGFELQNAAICRTAFYDSQLNIFK